MNRVVRQQQQKHKEDEINVIFFWAPSSKHRALLAQMNGEELPGHCSKNFLNFPLEYQVIASKQEVERDGERPKDQETKL